MYTISTPSFQATVNAMKATSPWPASASPWSMLPIPVRTQTSVWTMLSVLETRQVRPSRQQLSRCLTELAMRTDKEMAGFIGESCGSLMWARSPNYDFPPAAIFVSLVKSKKNSKRFFVLCWLRLRSDQ